MPPSSKLSANNEKDIVEFISAQDGVEFGPAERARTLRKLDWHLLPFVSLLYLLSFLDRANVMPKSRLPLSSSLRIIFSTASQRGLPDSLFRFLTVLQKFLPLKLFRPSRWIPAIMVAWGLVMTLMCLVNTYQGLVVARIFLGLAEAGLFPGVNYYISLWYPRAERSKRIAIFFSAATISGAFGGVLA
ncbi:MFS general substrate transporter [Paxillus ammoniavirescens]|nr:MFS general substrate transporter [Paxillus ammoniavirescens]